MAKFKIGKVMGPQGPQGIQGKTGTMKIGKVTTLQPGTSATVSNTGTTENAVLDFGIPRGDDGMTDLVAEYKDDWSHTCTPTVAAPVVIKEIAGKTEQAQTTGAQLLDQSKYAGGSVVNGVNIVLNDDGSMTLNGTTSQKGNVLSLHVSVPNGKYYFSVNATLPDGVYWQVNNNANNGSIGAIGAFDITDNGCYVYLLTKDSGVAINNVTLKLMINAGDTALPWEPYTGGKPGPNPDYPLDIKGVGNSGSLVVESQGKNLVDVRRTDQSSGLSKYNVCGDTITLTNMPGKAFKYNIVVIGNASDLKNKNIKLTISKWSETQPGYGGISIGRLKSTDLGRGFIEEVKISSAGSIDFATSYENKLDYDVIAIVIYANRNIGDNVNTLTIQGVMVTIGESVTPYQPYHHTTATIPLSSPLYDGDKICCVQPGESYVDAEGNVVTANRALWGVQRENGSAVFDGSEDEGWYMSGPISDNMSFRTRNNRLNGIIKPCTANNIVAEIKSDKYKAVTPNDTYSKTAGISTNTDSAICVYDERFNKLDSLSAWKAWLKSNPLYIVYARATPYFEPFPDQAPFHNLRSTNDLTYIYTDDPLKPEITVDVAKQAAGGYLLSGYMDREDGIMVDKTTGTECVLGMEDGLLTVYEIEED